MQFLSSPFAFFLVLVVGCFALAPGHHSRRAVLLAASLFFYASGDVRGLPVVVASVVLPAVVIPILQSQAPDWVRKQLMLLAVASQVALLIAFKYVDFLANSTNGVLALLAMRPLVPLTHWSLPLGLSFLTFQSISLVVDAYRRTFPPLATSARFKTYPRLDSALTVILSLLFFPKVIAGPLARAADFLPSLHRPEPPSTSVIRRAVLLLAVGLLKKRTADLLAPLTDRFFASSTPHDLAEAWSALFGYAAQLYADFSGYSDIALGVALLFGVTLPRNFALPYCSTSVVEFWNRWHISLSMWLRDYLYLPLALRRDPPAALSAVLVTFLVGGIWHGARWTCVIWGLYHAILIILTYAFRMHVKPWQRLPKFLRVGVGTLTTFYLVNIGYVFFRSADLKGSIALLEELHGFGAPLQYVRHSLLVASASLLAIVMTHLLEHAVYRNAEAMPRRRLLVPIGVLAVLFLVLAPSTDTAFLYAGF